jgi:glycosyltransferase involved in cell wall biosynthesis
MIILHDATLLGFYYGYYKDHRQNEECFKELYEKLYHDPIENAGPRYLSKDSPNYGFMEHVTRFCSGVVVHSNFHAGTLRKVYSGPLQRIYFPFGREYLSLDMNGMNQEKDSGKINLLTVGNVNRNKRMLEVIQVIGKNKHLKKAIHYTIIGSQTDQDYMRSLEGSIRKYDLSGSVKMIGYVDDETLAAHYRKADVLCNLRNPALEGASWSLVEQMSIGKPVIVSDNGFYSEIPEDCVFKISTQNEEEELTAILEAIVDNPDILKQKGDNARRLVESQFNQEQYAKAFMEFAGRIIQGKPVEALMNKIAFTLNQIGISKDMKIIDTISEQMELMFRIQE